MQVPQDKAKAHRQALLDMGTCHKGTAMIQMTLGEIGITNIDLPIPIYLLQHRPHKDLLQAPHKDPLVGHTVVIP